MRTYKVGLTPDAIVDLEGIYNFIAEQSGLPEVAWSYIKRLKEKCKGLAHSPSRGQRRDDIRPNLRIIPIAKNAVAAFEIDEENQSVSILNIFYGGRDYEVLLSEHHD